MPFNIDEENVFPWFFSERSRFNFRQINTVGGKVKFSCVDGPEFDATLVDWQELMNRNSVYTEKEKHICRLKL